ncbi:uncharacterized protein N0V89_011373 [Didymosphaeria variabile]|uniref:Uncharacterized protein n=1 Tax=Didymosphaeria variabile TaxID=1932322 RepID=A0A9W9C6C7_9PLEO|nr:uncharacterized protein N0V89_011373 [Didymosphaeria variabile]KAJ4345243.1 hypothetical protein N0V89_011373 [Didymosphaeria variabile]
MLDAVADRLREGERLDTAIIASDTHAPQQSVSLDVSSTFLECWDKKVRFGRLPKAKLFVGQPRALPCDADLVTKWEEVIKPRLMSDLESVCSWSTPNESFEAELCMAGVVRKEKVVELNPTVCIRCKSKGCRKEFERAVKDLDYLASFCFGRVEVRLGAPQLASMLPQSDTQTPYYEDVSTDEEEAQREAEIESLYKIQLEHHHEREERRKAPRAMSDWWIRQKWWIQELFPEDSACGLKLRIETNISGVNIQSISTIGGLIKIDEKIYGLTTGHGVIAPPDLPTVTHTIPSESSSEYESEFFGSDSESSDASVADANADSNQCAEVIHQIRWRDIPAGGLACFCGKTDIHNIVGHGMFHLNDVIHDADLKAGEVFILTGKYQTVCGYLLRGPASFRIKDALFQTRKIELREPLPKGVSGSWVVQGDRLCGVVLAVYGTEPYAHMITIDKVFQDIRIALKCTTIRVATEDDITTRNKRLGSPLVIIGEPTSKPCTTVSAPSSVASEDCPLPELGDLAGGLSALETKIPLLPSRTHAVDCFEHSELGHREDALNRPRGSSSGSSTERNLDPSISNLPSHPRRPRRMAFGSDPGYVPLPEQPMFSSEYARNGKTNSRSYNLVRLETRIVVYQFLEAPAMTPVSKMKHWLLPTSIF